MIMRKIFSGVIIICFFLVGCGKQESIKPPIKDNSSDRAQNNQNRNSPLKPVDNPNVPADRQNQPKKRHDMARMIKAGNFTAASQENQKFAKTLYESLINGDETAFLNMC